DPKGALQRVVKAVRADPDAGLEVGDVEVPATARVSSHREFFATGPARHVLEDYIRLADLRRVVALSGEVCGGARLTQGCSITRSLEATPGWCVFCCISCGI